ncbi:uncharacterized protein LOC117639645 [Thrips palmi]|uniref:Uncharacterized protein LOC117639645 n=1 Tax=Thrips palmi TaxID=161013 RepID=A0A6P8Y5Y8_THRPL|nr:uncharacterized protein LOC117639645 [Thrips palmi]XP_034231406.1 uncharacterized protein LOC117639645 [Thrips palmi]XP_034231407.1 uncharacterized protein LOC117639645 [Thrips palmi]
MSTVCKIKKETENQCLFDTFTSFENGDLLETYDLKLNYNQSDVKEEHASKETSVVLRTSKDAQELLRAREFLLQYSAFARNRRYLIDSERMLVVQCPSCFAEFKGCSDRMLRLIDHILARHPNSTNRSFTQVKKRYNSLINLYRKRLKD